MRCMWEAIHPIPDHKEARWFHQRGGKELLLFPMLQRGESKFQKER